MTEAISNIRKRDALASEIHKPKKKKSDDGYSFALIVSALDGFRLIQEKIAETGNKSLAVNGKEALKQIDMMQNYQYHTHITGDVKGNDGYRKLEDFQAYNEEITAERAVNSAHIQNLSQQAQILESEVSANVNTVVQSIQQESSIIDLAGQLAQQIAQI